MPQKDTDLSLIRKQLKSKAFIIAFDSREEFYVRKDESVMIVNAYNKRNIQILPLSELSHRHPRICRAFALDPFAGRQRRAAAAVPRRA